MSVSENSPHGEKVPFEFRDLRMPTILREIRWKIGVASAVVLGACSFGLICGRSQQIQSLIEGLFYSGRPMP